MAEVQHAPMHQSQPRQIPEPALRIPTSTPSMQPSSSAPRPRGSLLNLNTFSPVNENGSFEFDRVLKSGYVQKRTRKTKAWKPVYLVLRPGYLSLYKDQNEARLQHKIQLSDLTAVALLKDPKQKRHNVFGLFSPSRNYHMEASTRKDSQEWVSLIRREARIEEEEEELFLASPGGNPTSKFTAFEQAIHQQAEDRRLHDERLGSSSPEPFDPILPAQRTRAPKPSGHRRPSHIEYSGNEISDMSDADLTKAINAPTSSAPAEPLAVQPPTNRPMLGTRNASQMSGFNPETDPERVVWQGYLLFLKTSAGVRQWKDLWCVLRPRNLALYKNESEYSPLRIIPLSSVINAVEIDPLSRTKNHCMQIITEEKSYKFCAHSEEMLDKSLGAFKSLLAKRKDNEMKSERPR